MSDSILKNEERISMELRSLYKKYGYLPYKMSKFEAYDLYMENKEFLVGDGVIAFNDTDGRLLALKPDVTLSIIKNSTEEQGNRKVYYDENVYRISAKTKQFKEIMQVGLECLGQIDTYEVYETVCLACESLARISENYLLDISHLGIVSAFLRSISCGEGLIKQLTRLIGDKNAHETKRLCEEAGIDEADTEKLLALVRCYGEPSLVLERLRPLCRAGKAKQSFDALQRLCELLKPTPYYGRIRLDFSVVNDVNYYDDIVFKGFVEGIAEGVLSGGRYDKLLVKMGKKVGAIGFAVYLDLLEGFGESKSSTDVDVLVLYDGQTDVNALIKTVNTLVKEGKTVRAQKEKGVRYGELYDLRGGKI